MLRRSVFALAGLVLIVSGAPRHDTRQQHPRVHRARCDRRPTAATPVVRGNARAVTGAAAPAAAAPAAGTMRPERVASPVRMISRVARKWNVQFGNAPSRASAP